MYCGSVRPSAAWLAGVMVMTARARQVALGVLVAAEEVRPVADDRPADVHGEDVHVGRRLGVVGARALEEEREGRHRLALEAVAAPGP